MTLALAMSSFNAVHFAVGFILLICVLAIVIIGIKWLLTLAGITVPQPVLVMLGILVFMVLLIALLDYSGLYHF